MKILKHLSLSLLIIPVYAQDATEIIRKADEKMQGNSNKVEMTMTLIRPDWQREVKIRSWSKGTELSLIIIDAPARDKGTAFLKREKELWNWQPKIDRVIKMPPSMMMQSWMGSDFTNDDLVKQSSIVKDYHHMILKDSVIQGYDCYKIEMIPKEEAAVVWGKIEIYITKDELLQLLIKYYDEDFFPVNVMILSDIKTMDGRTIPTKLEMIPVEEANQKTVMVYHNMEFDIDISDQFFSLQNMKQIR